MSLKDRILNDYGQSYSFGEFGSSMHRLEEKGRGPINNNIKYYNITKCNYLEIIIQE